MWVGFELVRDIEIFRVKEKKVKINEYRYVYREIERDFFDDFNFFIDVKVRLFVENEISSCLEKGFGVSFEVLE